MAVQRRVVSPHAVRCMEEVRINYTSISKLIEMLEEYPPEAYLEINAYDDYGDLLTKATIYWEDVPTKKEVEDFKVFQEELAERQKENKLGQAKAALEKLSAKEKQALLKELEK